MMQGSRRIAVNLVAFAFLAAGLLYAMATQVLSLLQDRYKVSAYFPDAGGVFTNQEVTYRGVTVGQVGDLDVVDQGVRIELLIDEGVEVPAEDVEARVMFKSAVGEQFVDLLPRSEGPPFLRDGSKIPLEQTSIPVSTQELLSTLEAVLRGVPPESLRGAVDALGKGLTGRGPDIATLLESTAELAELFAERAPEIHGILADGTEVGAAFLRSSDDFAKALADLVPVSESLAAGTSDLRRLLQGTNLLSRETIAFLRDHRDAVEAAVDRLAEFSDLQADHRPDLLRLLRRLPDAVRGVVRSFEPETGLIRFGLLFDAENPSCDFATDRRPPEVRSFELPPKGAACGKGPDDRGPPVHGLPSSPAGSPAPSLPSRMSSWSWTLTYLHGM